jgi:Zn-dependent peptidase ImmA (M78 family)
MGLRRGFKTESNGLVREVRKELGIGLFDRLDPFALANHLGVPVTGLSQLILLAPDISYFIEVEKNAFSAVTVFNGSYRTIVHNDAHSAPRQNSNLAHELAHAILLHRPMVALDDSGCRYWNQDIEDEATWLGAALLVPEEMTLRIARGYCTSNDAAWNLGVSKAMITFRLNATGAARRVERERSHLRRPRSA